VRHGTIERPQTGFPENATSEKYFLDILCGVSCCSMSSLGKEYRSMANFETEWELEEEVGGQGEGILGAIGNALGGLLGEEESGQPAHEFEWEAAAAAHEGQPAHEFEWEAAAAAHEGQSAHEFEWEAAAAAHEGHPAHEFEWEASGAAHEGHPAHEFEWEASGAAHEGHPAHEFEWEASGAAHEGHPAHEFEWEAAAAAHEGHPAHEFEWEAGGIAHEGHPAHEFEWEGGGIAHEGQPAHEFEGGEQFFKRIARGIGGLVRRAAPFLKRIAKFAAPIVGTAIGGPFGAVLGRAASSLLGEGGMAAHEYEAHVGSHEAAQAAAHEIVHHEMTSPEVQAEMMAASAAQQNHEGEAEALAGAAAVAVLSAADRRALRRILPHLVRGVAILTRILRRRRMTRPAVRAVPTIVRRTVQTLKRQAASGQPVTRRTAARATVAQIRRVLGNPSVCAAAIAHNVRATRAARRPTGIRPTAG
jgi:hypothetical protein